MRKILWALALLVAAIFCMPQASASADDSRVILISIDGLMPSSYTDPALAAHAPNLRRLARAGIWADGVVGVFPTVTYPSHTTLITGVPPARHGIFDNRILDPEGRSDGAWYWYARAIQVPTLPMAVRARGLDAAAVGWPVTVGMDLDYVVPEYRESRHEDGRLLLDALSRPRDLLRVVESGLGHPIDWPFDDRSRTDIATRLIATYDPHVLLVHLVELDGTQHEFGPGSPEALRMLTTVDARLGEILEAVERAGRSGRTTVAVVSDHGFQALARMVQPNAAFRKAGLLSVDAAGRIVSWRAYYHASGGSGFVYVRDEADVPRVASLLDELRQNPANGIRRIWTREDLAEAGAHPDARFGLDVADGFYSGAGTDTLVTESATRGGHGFAPDRPAMHASLVMAGPSVRRHGSVGVIPMTRIAPTLARILGVSLAPDAGDPIPLVEAEPTAP
ncbi:MAG: ectonucleotide pyrophosphatase/phosphodiesterase [Vicinamibacterales bacterium]